MKGGGELLIGCDLLMMGSTTGTYEVQSIVGQGGMGVVYRAEDTKLKRLVALKFLGPAAIQDGESQQCF